ncbi:hypothetical protein C2G38_2207972 [Gigaspora rosea]|uniref:Uncharacterized protein n=1 Tax=Gigaspora rosea TaxID=44941 RepID=A0A397ULV0_9GLOM|nr:hypothetical protein C2G38_2207972 [Gigaspora rosea]
MFQGFSIKSKKTSKNTQSKKANKGKAASLESTRSTTLSESFSERFDNLGVNDNSGSNSYSYANTSESNERTLARIIENQGEILSELKVIKDKVGRIENRLNDLEQKMDNSFDITNDKAFKEDTIKGAAKALIEKAIYPKNSQIKSEAEKYVRENYAEYFERFTLKDWNVYYVNNIHGPIFAGTLTNKIKETLFSVYGNLIEPINNKAKPDEVIMWKKSTKTNEYYQKLFEELEEDSDNTYMNRILHKIWPDGKALPEKIAYAIAVCQTILNPKNKIITISDHVVKKLIAINLNKLEYDRHFSISSSEDETSKENRDETSKEDRDKSDDNDSENDNTEQGSKCKNNSNYSDKQNISKGCDFTNLILKITELVDLDLEEVQEAPDEDVDKEKETNNYEKNTDNDE